MSVASGGKGVCERSEHAATIPSAGRGIGGAPGLPEMAGLAAGGLPGRGGSQAIRPIETPFHLTSVAATPRFRQGALC